MRSFLFALFALLGLAACSSNEDPSSITRPGGYVVKVAPDVAEVRVVTPEKTITVRGKFALNNTSLAPIARWLPVQASTPFTIDTPNCGTLSFFGGENGVLGCNECAKIQVSRGAYAGCPLTDVPLTALWIAVGF